MVVSILLLNTYWLNHPTIYLPQALVLPSRSYELLFVLGEHDIKEEKSKTTKNYVVDKGKWWKLYVRAVHNRRPNLKGGVKVYQNQTVHIRYKIYVFVCIKADKRSETAVSLNQLIIKLFTTLNVFWPKKEFYNKKCLRAFLVTLNVWSSRSSG